MMEVKKISPIDDESFLITLEEKGDEYKFRIDKWEFIEDIDEILQHWADDIIPAKKEAKNLSGEDIKEIKDKYEGKEY